MIMTTDWQLQIREEAFIESFTEPQSNGSSLNTQQILEKNKRLNEEAERQWQTEFQRRGKERLILRDY